MLYPEFGYIGFKRDLRDRTKIVPLDVVSFDPKDGKEAYQSIYRFNQGVMKYESLADLESDLEFYSDYLVFDLDSHDLALAYTDTVRLVNGLKDMGAFAEVYFSGNKGFHVLVPSCQFGFVPTKDEGVLKRMATVLGARFSSFDPSIYNKTRIFRIPGSLNLKSGLYKIPLPDIESYTPDEILHMAQEPLSYGYPEASDYNKCALLCKIYEQSKQKINRVVQASEPKESFGDWGLIRDASEGNRNTTLYQMSRDLARHGIFERDALQIAHWWNKDLRPSLTPDEVDRTVKSAYRKGVNLLVADDNVFNFAFGSKKALAQVQTIYHNWEKNVVATGYPFLDKFTLGFFKEEVIFLISRPGNFKTCLLSNILHGIAQRTRRPCIFFSMEMGVEALTTRHIQKAERMTQLEVIKAVKEGAEFNKFLEEFGNVYVVSLSSLNTEKVLGIIDNFLEEYGPLGGIGFDYLSLFEGCANDTARTARMATELKTRVAKAANCPVFCLVQAKREYEGVGGDVEIDKTAGKDSSSIEDSGDYLIGTWGRWVNIPKIDSVTGDICGATQVKEMWGRFLKARKFDAEGYEELPYFKVGIERQYMNVTDFSHVSVPPTFRQKEMYGRD